MPYFVTFDEFYSNNRPLATALDDAGKSLTDALEIACGLLREQRNNVTIRDDNGNSITGADLLACCSGTKTLSANLQANS